MDWIKKWIEEWFGSFHTTLNVEIQTKTNSIDPIITCLSAPSKLPTHIMSLVQNDIDLEQLPIHILITFILILVTVVGIKTWRRDKIKIKHHHNPQVISVITKDESKYRDYPLHEFILEKCQSLGKHFYPTPWLSGGHSQTIFPALFQNPFKRSLPMQRQIVTCPDGGCIALDWANTKPKSDIKIPILLILPGLTGGSQDSYMQDLIKKCQESFVCVVFNFRGCGDSQVLTPQFYSASFTKDLDLVAHEIHSEYNNTSIYACGFSLGANILVKYAGETKQDCLFSGLVSVANPFDLTAVDEHLHSSFLSRYIYSKRFAKNMNLLLYKHKHLFEKESQYNINKIANCRTIREFDEEFTRIAFGFHSVGDYYLKSSCFHYVSGISRPCLCLNAMNDPIVPGHILPISSIISNPWVILCLTRYGGHLGWLENWILTKRWFTLPVYEYLMALQEIVLSSESTPTLTHESTRESTDETTCESDKLENKSIDEIDHYEEEDNPKSNKSETSRNLIESIQKHQQDDKLQNSIIQRQQDHGLQIARQGITRFPIFFILSFLFSFWFKQKKR